MKHDLLDLIKAFCARPMLYSGSHNFGGIMPFLNGICLTNKVMGKEFSDFLKWLDEKYGNSVNQSWVGLVKTYFPKDEDALEALPKLFEEFRSNQNFQN